MKSIVLLLLLAAGLSGQAEPLYPLLSKAAADSLRQRLWQSPPGHNRFDMLLALSTDILARHEELNTPLDSAFAYAQQAEALSKTRRDANEQISSQINLGHLILYFGKIKEGMSLLRQAIARSHQLPNPRLEADAWFYLGIAYDRTVTGMPERVRCFQQAQALYQNLGDKAKVAYVLKSIADIHLLLGKNEQAHAELLRVLALYRAVGYRPLHYTFDLLAGAARKMGHDQESLQYRLAAIASAKATQDTALLPHFYLQAGNLQDALNQPKAALLLYKTGLRYAQTAKTSFYIIELTGSIAAALINLHEPAQALAFVLQEFTAYPPSITDYHEQFSTAGILANCYRATKQFALAEKHGLQMVALIKTGKVYNDNYSQQLSAYLAMGKLYVATRQYAQARIYLDQALALHALVGNPGSTGLTHLLLFKVDSAQAQFPAAIAHYQQYQALHDSTFNATKSQQIARLEIQYETRQREQNIALLTKQNQVQQARIRQREWQRNATLAGLAMLVLLLGISYNRYRLKQRSNYLLEAQKLEINQKNQSLERVVEEKNTLLGEKEALLSEKEELLGEKEWMLKEIHHRVKNNLQIVSSLLNTQAKYLHDPEVLAAIQASKNRVLAMALIHQKLHQSESLARVNMLEYTQEIVDYLLDSFDRREWVTARLDLSAVELNVALATPIGLIINEAVTNVLKHAFPGNRRGTITIGLAQLATQHYELTIADDGVGWPPGFNLSQSRTLGLTIIQGLSEQVHGVLTFPPGEGVRVQLLFEVTPRPHRNGTGNR